MEGNEVLNRGRLKEDSLKNSVYEAAFSTPDSLALSADFEGSKPRTSQLPSYMGGVRQREEYLQQQIKLRNHRIADMAYYINYRQIEASEAYTKVEILDLAVSTERYRADNLETRIHELLQRLTAEKEAAYLAYIYRDQALAEHRITYAKLYYVIEERDRIEGRLIEQIALQQNYYWMIYENRRLSAQLSDCAGEKQQLCNPLFAEIQLKIRSGLCDEKGLLRWAYQRSLDASGDESFAYAVAQFKLVYGAIARGLEQQAKTDQLE